MEPLSQSKYNKVIQKKEGENNMTKKEKQVFQNYKDIASSKLVEAFNSGDADAITRATDSFVQLTSLWDELNNIVEQGA